jgi:hypothetical protein
MILRRVIAHFRNQEWAAIVIDFVIVVVGVFVGIEVSNWNAAQADKRLGRQYAERMTGVLEKELSLREALSAYYGAVLDSIERTDRLIADPAADPKELIFHAYRASEIIFVPQSRAVWDEIVAAGDISLLPPAAVDGGIADYFANDAGRIAYDALAASDYRRRVRTLIDLDFQRILRESCSDLRIDEPNAVVLTPECAIEVEPTLLAEIAAALRNDPALATDLRFQYSSVFTAIAYIDPDVVLLKRALAALRAAAPSARRNGEVAP